MNSPLSYSPILCLVTDRKRLKNRDIVDIAYEAVSGGVTMIQIREKDLSLNELAKLLEQFSKKIGAEAIIAVNANHYTRNFDLADAIHFPEDSPTIPSGSGKIIGRSVHSAEAAIKAVETDVDYLVAGTIFESASHPGRTGSGLEFLEKVVEISNKPVLGIGGITVARSAEVIHCGASGVAVISAILDSAEPARVAEEFMSNMRNAMDSQH